ncbi:hypothetical protein HNR44_002909 [Geomicrobium halophilum]|uniref:Uncharacterized protein n=1 Tax=Geomicrobium halophilum TaxID=549000 RepID=A0A841PQ99_9BACL|nr:hypothetical protein [Geomicrobium halophilum]
MTKFPLIENAYNPYRDNVQGKANEPITVAGLLDRSKQTLGQYYEGDVPDWTLEEIYDRLDKMLPELQLLAVLRITPHILWIFKHHLELLSEYGKMEGFRFISLHL